MLFRDIFIAVICVNLYLKTVKWTEAFIVIYAMFVVDVVISAFIVFKFAICLLISAFNKSWSVLVGWCYPFELFLLLIFSYAPILYFTSDAMARKLDLLDNPKPYSAQVISDLFDIQKKLDKRLDLCILQTIIIGLLIVHFSPEYLMSFKKPVAVEDEVDVRKHIIESKGFILVSKNPSVFEYIAAKKLNFGHKTKKFSGEEPELNQDEQINSPNFGSLKQQSSKKELSQRREIKSEDFKMTILDPKVPLDQLNQSLHIPQDQPRVDKNEPAEHYYPSHADVKRANQEQYCTSCLQRKRDVIFRPCLHDSFCAKCLGSSMGTQSQCCPVCLQACTSLLLYERILGSVNVKVLGDFILPHTKPT